MNFDANREEAKRLDAEDSLAHFRDRFVHQDSEQIYLDGNSLGRLPLQTRDVMRDQVDRAWGDRLIRSWNEGWFEAPSRVGDNIGQLIGAGSGQCLVADSTSVNLYKLALGVMGRTKKSKIITDNLNFPSDLYILEGVSQACNRDVHIDIVPSADGVMGPVEALLDAVDEDTALITLSHTVFKSGYTYPIQEFTARARALGVPVLWDLSHSVGAVPIRFDEWNLDLAVGCTYKYLNGGPGAPAFLVVADSLQEHMGNPISGWMGQKNLFDFSLDYAPERGVRRFLTGTPPILSLMAVESGVSILLEAGMDALRAKSVKQSEFFLKLWADHLQPLGFRLNSPQDVALRGSHISMGHDEGYGIDRALIEDMNVLPDFREPDNIRIGIAPLYNSFADLFEAVRRMVEVVEQGLYRTYQAGDQIVT